MSSQKKARGLPGMKEGPLVQMLDRQRVQQAAVEAKKLVDAAALSVAGEGGESLMRTCMK